MNDLFINDTITAIATAYGEGGIGIIRISGDKSKGILEKIFQPEMCRPIVNRRMTYGHIVDRRDNSVIDEVLCVYTKGPKTYTCEDVVEINCHGSMVALQKTLELVLVCGARLAERGEFTKRAFLNGRLDLSQAEAVIDIIKAKSCKTFDIAMDQLEGKYSKGIKAIRSVVMDTLVDLTVNIDYPDEDIEELTYSKLSESLCKIKNEIGELVSTAETGRILKEGLRVAIIGKPNVGKSSFMNNLLNESRAIVTDIAGTTRDTIEESLTIEGIPIVLTDTAGIRDTDNLIEKIGIEKSKESFNNADLVVYIIDGSKTLEDEDYGIIEKLNDKKAIVLINKADLSTVITKEEVMEKLPLATVIKTCLNGADDGLGITEVKSFIVELVNGGQVSQSSSAVVTNIRHKKLLEDAYTSIGEALAMTQKKEPLEFIEIYVNQGYSDLGEILGEAVGEDIINEVFSRFCLGK